MAYQGPYYQMNSQEQQYQGQQAYGVQQNQYQGQQGYGVQQNQYQPVYAPAPAYPPAQYQAHQQPVQVPDPEFQPRRGYRMSRRRARLLMIFGIILIVLSIYLLLSINQSD